MNILFFSDLHTHNFPLPECSPSLVVLLGDIPWQEVKRIDSFYSCPKVGVLGNHDVFDTYSNTEVIPLHKQSITIEGLKIAGFNGSPRYNGKHAPQYEEDEVSDFLSTLSNPIDLFIAHSNPMWSYSQDSTDPHRGFEAFSNFIISNQPSYFVHGHNHESTSLKVGHTQVLSVYPSLMLEINIM